MSHQQIQPSGFRYRRCLATAAGAGFGGILLLGAIGALGETAPLGVDGTEWVGPVVSPSVVILKSKHVLHLFDGPTLIRTYPIDLGTSPVGTKHRRGDGQTPLGRFRIVTRNADSPYRRFLGIDYPDPDTAAQGVTGGLITPGQYERIRLAHDQGRCPDWTTPLGGGVGIHGHRRGTDWTGGCVALSDEHVVELFDVLRIGDPVEILP